MAKYDKKAQEKVEKTMHEMKKGKLRSGTGKKVTSKKQAIAIGLSQARKEGSKAPEPEKKNSGSSKSKVWSKAASKNASAKGGRKSTSKKSGTRKKSSSKSS